MEKKNLLSLTVLILVVVISFIFWLTWQNSLELSMNFSIYLVGALILIPLITILNALFLLGRRGFVIAALALSVSPVLYIGQSFFVYAVVTFIFGFSGLLLIYQSFLKNRELFKKFNTRHLLQSKSIFLVLIFSLSLLTAGKTSLNKGSSEIKVPDQAFNFASKISSGLMGGDKSGQSSLQTAVANQTFNREIPRLKSELAKMGITDEKTVNEQIEAAREAYLAQVVNLGQNKEQTTAVIEDQMNTIRDSINNQLNELLSPYMIYLPYVIGFSFFLTLIFFSAFFTFLSDLLFLLSFKLLLHAGLVTVKTRTEEVEFLEI